MNLDKNPDQIVVLVVLIAVGAGAYFMQQGVADSTSASSRFLGEQTTTTTHRGRSQAPATDRSPASHRRRSASGQSRYSRDSALPPRAKFTASRLSLSSSIENSA
jgi:hypothetical protein